MYLCGNFLFSTDFRKPYCALDYWVLQEKSSKYILLLTVKLPQPSALDCYVYLLHIFILYTTQFWVGYNEFSPTTRSIRYFFQETLHVIIPIWVVFILRPWKLGGIVINAGSSQLKLLCSVIQKFFPLTVMNWFNINCGISINSFRCVSVMASQ